MAAADRDLLFGLLALQNGLIDQTQLVDGVRGLDRRRGPDAGRSPRLPGPSRPTTSARLSRPSPVHLETHGGRTERSLAAISAGSVHPRDRSPRSATPTIEQTLAHVGSGRRVRLRPRPPPSPSARPPPTASGSASSGPTPGAAWARSSSPSTRSCTARSALKQILDKHADDPTSRARFLLEAEITGGLEHPGIVPVYGLGTYADGRPYYAMRFIRGDSLKEAVDRFHCRRSRPGQRRTPAGRTRSSCASCCGGSSTSATPSTTPTAAACSTATSSRATSSSASTARRWWSTGGWPRRRAGPTRRRTWASGRWSQSSASGSRRDAARPAPGHAGLHEPRAGRGGPRAPGPAVGRLQPGRDALLPADRPAAGRGGHRRRAPRRAAGRVPAAAAARPDDRPGAGGGLPEGDGAPAGGSLRVAARRWPRTSSGGWPTSRSRPGASRSSRRARRWAKRNRTAVTAAAVALWPAWWGCRRCWSCRPRPRPRSPGAGPRDEANKALAAANDELSRSRAAVQARYELAVEAIKTFHTGVSEDFLLKEEKFKELRDRLLKSASDFYGKLSAPAGQGDGPGLASGAGGGELRAGRPDGEGGTQRGRTGRAPLGPGGAPRARRRAGSRRPEHRPRSAAA